MHIHMSFPKSASRRLSAIGTSLTLAPSKGFSLIELLIVISIMSVLAAIALPKINLHQFRIDAGVRVVQGAMQQAERYAVQRQHDIIISFDVPGKRILIIDDQNNNAAADAGEKVMVRVLEDGVRFASPPAAIGGGAVAAVAGAGLVPIGGYPSITFHRDGATSTALQVYITSTRPNATDFKALNVTQSTGHVDYYSYTTGTWKRGGA
jgi:prepilin-type N-terminal cleavage/methylation domain-containing protein